MKKILFSSGLIIFVAAAVMSATGAFFSDTETSTGNVFAAGAIDLLIDNTSYGFDWNDPLAVDPTGVWGQNQNNSWQLSNLTNQLFFDFADLKPGDFGEDTISIHVDDNDAWACMAFALAGTPENGQTEPEADVDVTVGANEGELQNYLSFLFWADDGDNVFETDESLITSLQGLPGEIFDGNWLTIADSGTETPLPGGSTQYIGKGWCFGDIAAAPVDQDGVGTNPPQAPDRIGFTCNGADIGNDAQTDGIVVDVSFHAEQSRHNNQFLCSSLPDLVAVGGRPVGAALAEYNAPQTCDVTVDGDTIQSGVDEAAPGEVVCVTPGTYDEVVNVNEQVTIAATGAVGSAVVEAFIIDADNVTVKGFEVNGGLTEGTFAGFYIKSGVDNLDIVFNDIDGPAANDLVTPGGSRGIVNVSGAPISDILVQNNIIHEWTSGVYTNPDAGAGIPWMIRYNDIDDNSAGIGELNGAHVVANEFTNVAAASEAIGVGPTYDGGSVSNNNFLTDTRLNTYGPIATDVDAENNFWGPNGGATQTGGTDEVDFTPESLVIFPHN